MRTLWIRRFVLACNMLMGLWLFIGVQVPSVHAANPTVMIVQPSVNGIAIGHVGTKVSIQGSNFLPNRLVRLYTTTSNDPAQCAIGNANLSVFSTNPTSMVKADGTFAVGADNTVTWPTNAAHAGQKYTICAIAARQGGTALSSNTFTVADPVTINVSPTTVQGGGHCVVTGSNWYPPQPVTINIYGNNEQNPLITDTTHNSNADGTISITLTLPANAQAQTYSVHVFAQAQNEVNMSVTQNNVLTVAQIAPTPTLAPSPTATPVPTVALRPTVVPTPASTSTVGVGTIGSMNVLVLLALGGLGLLLVFIGIILFVIYSRSHAG